MSQNLSKGKQRKYKFFIEGSLYTICKRKTLEIAIICVIIPFFKDGHTDVDFLFFVLQI